MRRILAPALAGLLLAALAAAARAGDASEPTWYATAVAHGDAGMNVTNFWSKGAKLRAETVIEGHRIVTIVNGRNYYAYDSLGAEGVAIVRAPKAIEQDDPKTRPFGREAVKLVEQGAERVREERIMGRLCEVYRVTDRQGRREVWVTKGEPHLPVRLSIFRRGLGVTQYTDYLNWRRGLEMPDAFFEPEDGVTLQRMDLETYVSRTLEKGPVGPVPVLYADLLHGTQR